ncbi:MAG: S41 family peptidase [Clostridia bacterium]|nr:S41 family peptidase [Clostridia bacterium]
MKKIAALLLAFTILFSTAVFAEETEKDYAFTVEYMDMIMEFIAENYKFGVTEGQLYETVVKKMLDENPELFEEILKTAFGSLDKNSEFLNYEEMQDLMGSIEASVCGIGVNVQERGGEIVVVSPIENSPAKKAGILSGDVIVSVDDEDITGKSLAYAQSIITGDKGTEVKIGIHRAGQEGIIYFTIIRDKFEQKTVAGSIVEDGKIGYLAISSFSTHTASEVKEQMEYFDKAGIKKLIIDLRNNPGGDKDALIEILRMFTPKGPIFNIEFKDSKQNEKYYNNKDNSKKYKIVVLVNEYSASAAEAFAGTMKDTKSAQIVGTTTYGKGTVQTVNGLLTGAGFRLTIATYTTAKGTPVDGIGVIPDFEIKNKKCLLSQHPEVKDIEFSAEINENSSEESIYTIEQRLNLLNIYTGQVDGVFDNDTRAAVKLFQETYSHEVTGKMDIMTQVDLHNATRNMEVLIDSQYNKAIELLK